MPPKTNAVSNGSIKWRRWEFDAGFDSAPFTLRAKLVRPEYFVRLAGEFRFRFEETKSDDFLAQPLRFLLGQ